VLIGCATVVTVDTGSGSNNLISAVSRCCAVASAGAGIGTSRQEENKMITELSPGSSADSSYVVAVETGGGNNKLIDDVPRADNGSTAGIVVGTSSRNT